MKFKVDKNINIDGSIMGLSRVLFYIYSIITIMVVFFVFTNITFTKFIIAILFQGIVYLVFLKLTNFNLFSYFMSDKMPDIIVGSEKSLKKG